MHNTWWMPWLTVGAWGVAVTALAIQTARRGAPWPAAAAWAAIAAWGPIALFVVGPWLPTDVLTPLHEVFTEGALAHAAGYQVSEDLPIASLRHALEARTAPTQGLVLVTSLEVGVHAAAVVAWGMAAWRAGAPAWGALGFAALWAIPPFGPHMALSATGASHLLFLGGLLAWNLAEAERDARWSAIGAWVVSGALVVLLLWVRRDARAWGIGLTVLLTLGTHPVFRRVEDRVSAWFGAGAPWRALGVVGLVWAAVAGVASTLPLALPLGSPAWMVMILAPPTVPLKPLFPAVIAGMPLVVFVLMGIGMGRSIRRPMSWLALVVIAGWAWQADLAAAHGGLPGVAPVLATFEAWRYLMFLAPVIGGISLLGLIGVHGMAPRLSPLVLLAVLVPPIPEALGTLSPVWPVAEVRWPRVFGLQSDLLRETRAFVDLHQRPEGSRCWIVTRSLNWRPEAGLGSRLWVVTVFKSHLATRVDVDAPDDATPAQVLHRAVADTPWLHGTTPDCAIAWWSMDCRDTEDPGCAAIAALPPTSPRVRLDGIPFVHPDHGAVVTTPGEIGAHHLSLAEAGLPYAPEAPQP